MHDLCRVLPWLIELSGVLPSFTLSRQTFVTELINHTTGRLVHAIRQGNCLFKVMGEETCQYLTALDDGRLSHGLWREKQKR